MGPSKNRKKQPQQWTKPRFWCPVIKVCDNGHRKSAETFKTLYLCLHLLSEGIYISCLLKITTCINRWSLDKLLMQTTSLKYFGNFIKTTYISSIYPSIQTPVTHLVWLPQNGCEVPQKTDIFHSEVLLCNMGGSSNHKNPLHHSSFHLYHSQKDLSSLTILQQRKGRSNSVQKHWSLSRDRKKKQNHTC